MATVVLTIAGGLIGGPLGAGLGGLIGNTIDRQLLRPGTREGARLADLRVQTSSYGTQIPKLFGRLRVAGSVIWATDLIEHRATEGGGKGRGAATVFTYTASFAVALSARPILRVERIWADGQLLRGAAGDFKVRTGFRLHRGSEDQPVDPLIASAEGIGLAPAHRGIAYAVFEDLELATFGNRIPQLSFEVVADPAPVALGTIASGIAPAIEGSALSLPVAGFSVQGPTIGSVLENILAASGGWLRSEGQALRLIEGDGAAQRWPDAGAHRGEAGRGRGTRSIAAADTAALRVSVQYYDAARDYQAGVQQACRDGPGNRDSRIELPAVLEAGAAKALAAGALLRADSGRERRTITLGWDALAVRPGERIAIEGAPGQWRVDRWSLERMTVRLECVRIARTPIAGSASAGRAVAAPDERHGATMACWFELPPLDETPLACPRFAVAAAGTATGWRRAMLSYSRDGGISWEAAGSTAYPAVLGTIVEPPGTGCATLTDGIHHVIVELANAAMVLANADDRGLDAGANLAMLGAELIQFARAEPLGGTHWRLSRLWRGRRGTDPAIGTQRAGDRFVLLTRDTVKLIDLDVAIGRSVKLLAQGVEAESDVAPLTAPVSGISLLPPAPVQLHATREGSDIRLRWARRSRAGGAWQDGVDIPIGEQSEAYAVEIDAAGRVDRLSTSQPSVTIGAAGLQFPATLRVFQIGTYGRSTAATLTLSSLGDVP